MIPDFTPIEKLDELPSRESSKEVKGWYDRNQDLPWRKGRRWVESKVGKTFNEAFSEWVHLEWVPERYRNKEGFHLFAAETCFYHKTTGELLGRWGYPLYSGALYVDPTTNIICQVKRKKTKSWRARRKEEEEKYSRILGPWHQFAKMNGIWYEIQFSYTEIPKTKSSTDYSKTPYFRLWETSNISSYFFPINMKRQLSHKELKQHNLKND